MRGRCRADAFVAITDVAKIRRDINDPDSTVDRLSAPEIENVANGGLLVGGMLPKVDAALAALRHGARRAIVAGGGNAAVRAALDGAGTEIYA